MILRNMRIVKNPEKLCYIPNNPLRITKDPDKFQIEIPQSPETGPQNVEKSSKNP